jgi:hypothetical protein
VLAVGDAGPDTRRPAVRGSVELPEPRRGGSREQHQTDDDHDDPDADQSGAHLSRAKLRNLVGLNPAERRR